MYESYTTVGERGQITLPKIIREKANIKPKSRLIVKIENQNIVIEKPLSKKEKEKLMIDGYKKTSKLDLETAEDWKYTSD
ncbi:MAG TPA: AbrB/MazE/SpoVT family DNA-binding domain-containing protein [archaeon]|nr:AbrB/MazE/SpoVT family DNA-binding domain-containing protein [archaeon]HPV66336.1 AbrB/MazE/SpoVT family DNA-binding domain-containing protein [archaeon]HRS42601.1 AbrB/MazE/SpoVT family DNA-binding domain-containing protein [Candidatus Diapherotrites archaeon]